MPEYTTGPWYAVLTRIVRDVGFPIFVAAYLLLQLGPQLERLNVVIEHVSDQLDRNHDIQVQLLAELRRRAP